MGFCVDTGGGMFMQSVNRAGAEMAACDLMMN